MLKKTNKKIILVGDFSINQFYEGNINRIAHDAPIPIVDVTNSEIFSGSAGIIVETLSRLGAKNLIPIGLVGDDFNGRWIRNRFMKMKIHTSRLLEIKRKTPRISRIMVNNIQVSRFDEISQNVIDDIEIEKIVKIITKELKNTDLVIIADYGFGSINKKIAQHIIQESKRRNVDVLVTSTGYNYLMYRGLNTIIKINLENSALLIKEPQISTLSSHLVCSKLSELFGSNRILLTRGEEGIAIYEQENTVEMPATEDKRVDVKGIGETMTAVIGISLVNSEDFSQSCKLGNIAAGVAVSKSSTDTISINDIIKAKLEYDKWSEEK